MGGSLSRIRRLLSAEDGPTAVEYAVMLALIVMACIAVIQALGAGIRGTFGRLVITLIGPGGAGPPR